MPSGVGVIRSAGLGEGHDREQQQHTELEEDQHELHFRWWW
jgi:hypothetical protein